MAIKTTPSALILRLKNLFVRKKPDTQIQQIQESAHTGEAFRAGAAVTFITPIGAYAGNTATDTLRIQAIAQFHQMDTTTHTTIN